MNQNGTEMIWKVLEFDPEVTVVAATGNSLYASAPSGLHRSQDDGASWQRLRDPASLLAAAPDGLWADLQFSADGKTWTSKQRLPVEAREVNELTILSAAPSGEVWVALRQKWLGSSPDTVKPAISHCAEMAGDFVFRGSRDLPFKLVLKGIRATGIAFDFHGRTWISSGGGVFVDGQRVFERAADCIAVDADNHIVVGTCMSAFVSKDGEKFEPVAVRTVGSIECDLRRCNVLARGSDGAVWAGTSCGVFRLDGTNWCAVNRGISSCLHKRGRQGGIVEVVSLAFTQKAFAVARGVGLLCGASPGI